MSFSRQEIARLFKTAKRVLRHPAMDILCAPATQPQARILVATPKKIGNAPDRNKVRRRLKAIFYEEKFFDAGYDCVVIVKNLDGINFDILKQLLTSALAKAQSSGNSHA